MTRGKDIGSEKNRQIWAIQWKMYYFLQGRGKYPNMAQLGEKPPADYPRPQLPSAKVINRQIMWINHPHPCKRGI